jgi:DNA polymerase alpha-associated DNA helicase A
MQEREYSTLIRVLFGLDSPTPLPANLEDVETGAGKVEFFDPTLNDSQRDAVRFALASREVALIHGPPGVRLFHYRRANPLLDC